MEEQKNLLDADLSNLNPAIDEQKIISTERFIFLSIISFGLYEVYWIYKAWKFFKQKENTDINPAARAIFSLFFLNSLLEKILSLARAKGYKEGYSASGLTFGFIVCNFLSRLPDPFWLLSFLSIVFLIKPFTVLSYAKENSDDFVTTDQYSFSNRQILLIVLGSAFWLLVLLGLFMGDV